MSKDIEFKLDLKGLNALMKSPEMQAIEESALAQVAGQLGDGFRVEHSHRIGFISIASIRPRTWKARLEQNRHNVIDTALGGVKI